MEPDLVTHLESITGKHLHDRWPPIVHGKGAENLNQLQLGMEDLKARLSALEARSK